MDILDYINWCLNIEPDLTYPEYIVVGRDM